MDTLYIKNMVCPRCIMAVEDLLQSMNLPFREVRLGEAKLENPISPQDRKALETRLSALGFALINQKDQRIIEQIKHVIIQQVHGDQNPSNLTLSELLSQKLHWEYSSLSQLFSRVEGVTIEKYYIAQRIEKVKELLVYDELSLTEIADLLQYSSVSYLSNQFKQVTGLRPSHFKKLGTEKRKSIDQI